MPRLDYAVLNDTGERVLRSVQGRDQVRAEQILETFGENSPDMDEKFLYELKIKEDLENSLDLYALDDLDCEEDINEGVRIISELCKNLRHVHVDLRSGLQEDYQEQYPDYPDLEKKGYLKS